MNVHEGMKDFSVWYKSLKVHKPEELLSRKFYFVGYWANWLEENAFKISKYGSKKKNKNEEKKDGKKKTEKKKGKREKKDEEEEKEDGEEEGNFDELNIFLEQEENKNSKNKEIKRVHRVSSNNLENISEEGKTNDNSILYFNIQNKKKNKIINEEKFKEKDNKELIKRKNINIEFNKLYFKMREQENPSLNNNENKKNLLYYIIDKTWFEQFKSYCAKTNLEYSNFNEDYPGPINNQHLILKEENCIKLNSENRIILNPNYSDNCPCLSQEIWLFLMNLFGGGPEIKLYPFRYDCAYDLNETNTIRRGAHINLIFLPKKQIISNNNNEPSNKTINPLNLLQCLDDKKVSKNIDDNKIRTEKIYFDISKNVKELSYYINLILNQHRDKFTNTPIISGNSEENSLAKNIYYHLWILILNGPTDIKHIIDSIQEQIAKYKDVDFPMNFTQINNNISNIVIIPYLLTDFLQYKIMDVFPNKYTNNFDNTYYYNKIEDENTMPEMYILIEENPFHFFSPKKNYCIRKCDHCQFRDYVFSGCRCQKVFYCSEQCKQLNLENHIISCKIALYDFLLMIFKKKKEDFENNKINKEKFPILGLQNLGNSCYMNSALQCIFATKELSDYFLYNFSEKYINKNNILGSGGLLTLGYINLLLNINNTTNNEYISPGLFKVVLSLCSSKFEGNEQEDAHEFIIYLLDIFHEDINRVIKKPNNDKLKYNSDEISSDKKSVIDWNNFLKRNQSVLIDLFYGQLKSSAICPICHYHSIKFNSFFSLELSIEESTNQEIKLEKLFYEFSMEEKLDRDNLYKCEKCKEKSEANKTIEIYHVPKILIIHLKRFNNNKKINTFIDFPLRDLDINEYIKSNDSVAKYDLFGIINHYGSMEYGHYTSYCFNYHDHTWYEYNDRLVNKIPKEKEKDKIINKNAYILFYRCQDNDSINWDVIYNKKYENINENNLKLFGADFVLKENPKKNLILGEINNITNIDKSEIIPVINIDEKNEIEDNIDKDINEIKEIKKEECKLEIEIKTTGIFSSIKRTKNNTFRIKTFHETRKKEN